MPVLENQTLEDAATSFVGKWVIMECQKTRGMSSLQKIGYITVIYDIGKQKIWPNSIGKDVLHVS